jgi:hypothetical protein
MRVRARGALPTIFGGALALAVFGFYIAILSSEGEGELTRPAAQFLAAVLAASGLVLLGAWSLSSSRVRYGTLQTSAWVLSAWAILGSFSIGMLLVPSAILAWLAALAEGRRLEQGERRWIGAASVALGVGAMALALSLPG